MSLFWVQNPAHQRQTTRTTPPHTDTCHRLTNHHHLSSRERDTRHDAQPPPATQPCRRRVLRFGSSNHACALVANDVSSTTSPCALRCSDGSDSDRAWADASRVACACPTNKPPITSSQPPSATDDEHRSLFSLPTSREVSGISGPTHLTFSRGMMG
jgi:hypothetical protein